MSATPLYEVYALLYAKSLRPSRDYFVFPDPHDGPLPIHYYVWVIRNAERTILVDTGFSRERALARKRDFLRCPTEGLASLEIRPEAIETVVLTHLHYDHAGNIGLFPQAEFLVQDEEMRFATGRSMRHPALRGAFEAEDVVELVRCNFNGRVRFLAGDGPLAPGIDLLHVGGHTWGLQAVSVQTRRGRVILVSDAAHFYENIALGNPFPIVADVAAMLEGHSRLLGLAETPDHLVPGHDPLVMEMFPALDQDDLIVDLAAQPLKASPLAK